MKTLTLEWSQVLMIELIADTLILLICAFAFSVRTKLFASVGWHGLVSVDDERF